MALKLVRFHEFNVKTDNWDNYIDRLKYCFEANGIKVDSVRRANCCTICGAQALETLVALITPKNTSDVTFDEIISILTKHYSPKSNDITASYKFYKPDQTKDETAAEYITQLRMLISIECNFPNLECMLRDRLVCGMSDRNMQYQLLKRDNLSFKDVVDAMLSAERAGKPRRATPTSQSAAGTSPPAPEPMDINAMKTKPNVCLCYRCGDRHAGDYKKV